MPGDEIFLSFREDIKYTVPVITDFVAQGTELKCLHETEIAGICNVPPKKSE